VFHSARMLAVVPLMSRLAPARYFFHASPEKSRLLSARQTAEPLPRRQLFQPVHTAMRVIFDSPPSPCAAAMPLPLTPVFCHFLFATMTPSRFICFILLCRVLPAAARGVMPRAAAASPAAHEGAKTLRLSSIRCRRCRAAQQPIAPRPEACAAECSIRCYAPYYYSSNITPYLVSSLHYDTRLPPLRLIRYPDKETDRDTVIPTTRRGRHDVARNQIRQRLILLCATAVLPAARPR